MNERKVEIFCPKCGYRPQPSDNWACLPSCGTVWNTFETCGVCPGCGKNWEDTQCPACFAWSRHQEWYHETAPVAAKVEEAAMPV